MGANRRRAYLLAKKKISRVFSGARAFHRSEFYGAKLKSDPFGLLADTIVGKLTGKAETHPHKQRTTCNRKGNRCNSHKVIRKGGKSGLNSSNHLSILSKP